MESRSRMILAWVSGIIIVGLSLAVAYVCFVILGSSAEGTLRNWKLGGGLAGFIITASFLSSTLMSIYRVLTADQITEYQKQIQELQAKLIKGAPCPPGYTVEIDERHKLVFARPRDWAPKGGMLYQYVEKIGTSDTFAANFNVQVIKEDDLGKIHGLPAIDGSATSIDAFYSAEIDQLEKTIEASVIREHITVDGLRSAKYLSSWDLSDQEGVDPKIPILQQVGVITYVPEQKAFFVFSFGDETSQFFETSTIFSNVITSIRFLA